MNDNKLMNRAADNIRILAASMVEKANSGHPGGAMGGADFVNVLFSEFLVYDPENPRWEGRDRFFLDPGHMSPMLYSTLALTGKFTLDELKEFRQWGSPTPGHPEVDIMRGIENTSGPLGQGHTFAVGAAIAAKFLKARFNEVMNQTIYAYISDGGIQEEISQGAGRIAGALGLDNLIMFYDSNDIQLSTETKDVTVEDTAMKYEAWGWNVLSINGNDPDEIRAAIKEAQAEKEKTRQARQELTEFRQSMEALASKEQEEKIARKMQKLQEKQNRKKEKKTKDTDNGLSAQEQAAQKAKQEAERLASIVPGAMVKIKGQNSVGEVLKVNGKNAVVAFGSIKTTIKVERLERTNIVPQKVDSSTKSTFVSNQTQDSMYEKKLNFKQDIDVRGMRGDEALQAVTYFIDDAILVGMSRVRILHGTGTGILRTLIRQYLQTVPGIRHFADEHVQFGGAGITVVDL